MTSKFIASRSFSAIVIIVSLMQMTFVSNAKSKTVGATTPTLGAISRTDIIARAQIWVEQHITYSTDIGPDGYRHDCSGFVSMAWELPNTPPAATHGGPVTTELAGFADPITDYNQLAAGDILLKPGYKDARGAIIDGHVALFVGWDESYPYHTRYIAYEESPDTDPRDPQYHGDAVETSVPYPYWDGGYQPYRRKNVTGSSISSPTIGAASGYVKNSDGSPAGNLRVTATINGAAFSTTTDASGHYFLNQVPTGSGTLAVSLGGNQLKTVPITIAANATTSVPPIYIFPACSVSHTNYGAAAKDLNVSVQGDCEPPPTGNSNDACKAQPRLVSPGDGAVVNNWSVQFSWAAPPSCNLNPKDGYTVHINANADPEGKPILFDQGIGPNQGIG